MSCLNWFGNRWDGENGVAAWISAVTDEMEKSWQCNGCCRCSNTDDLDMMVEGKWDSYLWQQRDFDWGNERKSDAVYKNVAFVVWMETSYINQYHWIDFFIVSQLFILIPCVGYMILHVSQVNHLGHSTVFIKWILYNGSS